MQHHNSENKIWFLGRSFKEYVSMFDLNLEKLKNCQVLDCNAGSSSFTAHMNKQGFDVVAADILYGQNPEKMEKISRDDFKTLMEAHHGLENKVDWGFFKNAEEMNNQRIKTYEDFYNDYQQNYESHYVKVELPKLPFSDNSFHLVLSSHLLFLYDDRLDYNFHYESIKEMLRVCSQEVRIYPLVSLRSPERSKFVEKIIQDLSTNYFLEIKKINYRFRKGADEMLRISKIPFGKSNCGLHTLDAIKIEGK